MKEKITLLYCERTRFGGYMLILIEFWYGWMNQSIKKHDDWWEEKLSHNSVVFIERAVILIKRQNQKARMAELRARWSN